VLLPTLVDGVCYFTYVTAQCCYFTYVTAQCSYSTCYCTVYVTLPFLLHSVVTLPMLLQLTLSYCTALLFYLLLHSQLLYLCYCIVVT